MGMTYSKSLSENVWIKPKIHKKMLAVDPTGGGGAYDPHIT